jgi:hypothetical protein
MPYEYYLEIVYLEIEYYLEIVYLVSSIYNVRIRIDIPRLT